MSDLITNARSVTLADLHSILIDQQGRKLDFVAKGNTLNFEGANLVLSNLDLNISADGVEDVNGSYRPTDVFDEGVAAKLKIPLAYLRRMRQQMPYLYDENVNTWLADDDRAFTVRAFRGNGGEGIARALLSDKYGVVDNLDILTAAFDGIRQAGVKVEVEACDLTDRKMYVRIVAPEVQALAPILLARYRSPFTGAMGADNPIVFAGFVISNSETGGGAATLTPRMIVQVCKNGMTIKKDAMRAVHLGSQSDEGLIRWTADTREKELAAVTARARDSVATFLDVEYMKHVLGEMEEKAAVKVKADKVDIVTTKLGFDEQTRAEVFNMFIEGADLTAGGVMHAVTAAAQGIPDADKAHEVEGQGLRALDLAAAS